MVKVGITVVSIIEDTAIISALAAILLAVFTVMQLRHLEKHRNVDISMKLFEWAETDRLRKAFRWMDRKYEFKSYADFKLIEEEDVEASEYPSEVTSFFEQVGFLVEKKFVDLDVVVDRLGHYVVLNWRKLEPWVMAMRGEKHDPTYGEHFHHLYNHTVKYMNKRCSSGETNFCTDLETTPQ
jgi:hypothetical protein